MKLLFRYLINADSISPLTWLVTIVLKTLLKRFKIWIRILFAWDVNNFDAVNKMKIQNVSANEIVYIVTEYHFFLGFLGSIISFYFLSQFVCPSVHRLVQSVAPLFLINNNSYNSTNFDLLFSTLLMVHSCLSLEHDHHHHHFNPWPWHPVITQKYEASLTLRQASRHGCMHARVGRLLPNSTRWTTNLWWH